MIFKTIRDLLCNYGYFLINFPFMLEKKTHANCVQIRKCKVFKVWGHFVIFLKLHCPKIISAHSRAKLNQPEPRQSDPTRPKTGFVGPLV